MHDLTAKCSNSIDVLFFFIDHTLTLIAVVLTEIIGCGNVSSILTGRIIVANTKQEKKQVTIFTCNLVQCTIKDVRICMVESSHLESGQTDDKLRVEVNVGLGSNSR